MIVSIIFSKDRAMQLQATIASFYLHCMDNNNTRLTVLYKASNELHQNQYETLKQRFPAVQFIEETGFREQVISAIENSDYVLFLVDDNMFVKPFNLREITTALNQQKDAIGFSLRLGRNTTYCYPMRSSQRLPEFLQVDSRIVKYNWVGKEYDFGYPLEVSSSVYKTREIVELLARLKFNNPNQLEGAMSANAKHYAGVRGVLLCYSNSVTFCNPINVVQKENNNRFGTTHNYTSQELADSFSGGLAIDVEKYAGFTPRGAHQEVELYFKAPAQEAGINVKDTHCDGQDFRRKHWRPAFSVIMANYNHAGHIDDAIQSVIRQTFEDWELIVVDDASTDCSVEKIKTYLRDGRIRLVQHQKNRGYTGALKTGIANVQAEYFGILDSDDALTPNAVETMYRQHGDNPDCGMIYSQFIYCDEKLVPRSTGFCSEIPAGKTNLDMNCVSHFKTFKLQDYLKTSGYDETVLYAEDKDISYKMEEVTKLKFVSEGLYLYRELPDSIGHAPATMTIGWQSLQRAKADAMKRRARKAAAALPQKKQSDEKSVISLVKAVRMFHEAQNAFGKGDRLGAERLMLQYKAQMNYADLPVIDKRLQRCAALISVIIVTYQGTEKLIQLLNCLDRQTSRDFEIIVVDNGGTDVRSIAGRVDCTILCPICFGRDEGRNIGASFARGKAAVFLEDNTVVDDDYIASICMQKFSKPAGNPLVSIYMGAYNTEAYIQEAINSVLIQTFGDYELLIIDDGSTDRTADIVSSYKDSRIRFIRQEHKNFAAVMNRAISEARGEFVIGIDSDDSIEPDYLQKMVSFALANPGFDYYYPASLLLNDTQQRYARNRWDYLDFEDNRNLPAFLFMNGFSPIPNSSSLKRKTLFEKTGLYRDLDAVEDFDFLARNALKIRFKRVDGAAGYHYRINPAGNSHRFIRRNEVTAGVLDEMVSIYAPESLCPPIVKTTLEEKGNKYLKYVFNVFQNHANRNAMRGGEFYERYAEKYRPGFAGNLVQTNCF